MRGASRELPPRSGGQGPGQQAGASGVEGGATESGSPKNLGRLQHPWQLFLFFKDFIFKSFLCPTRGLDSGSRVAGSSDGASPAPTCQPLSAVPPGCWCQGRGQPQDSGLGCPGVVRRCGAQDPGLHRLGFWGVFALTVGSCSCHIHTERTETFVLPVCKQATPSPANVHLTHLLP